MKNMILKDREQLPLSFAKSSIGGHHNHEDYSKTSVYYHDGVFFVKTNLMSFVNRSRSKYPDLFIVHHFPYRIVISFIHKKAYLQSQIVILLRIGKDESGEIFTNDCWFLAIKDTL